MVVKNTTKKVYTHRSLLKDLSEIKAVLDVEAQLIRAAVRMATARKAGRYHMA